jgi:hypothetical protein
LAIGARPLVAPMRCSRPAVLSTLLSLATLAPAQAMAAPPDVRLVLSPGAPRIDKVTSDFTAVVVEAPAALRAEILPAGELLLEPVAGAAATSTHVFLFAPRLVRVLEVAIGRPLEEPAPAPGGACKAPVVTAACYPAWRARLSHLEAAQAPRLTYELEGLQAEARAATLRLAAAGLGHLAFARSAMGVRLVGARDAAERQRALCAVWDAVLGTLRVEE